MAQLRAAPRSLAIVPLLLGLGSARCTGGDVALQTGACAIDPSPADPCTVAVAVDGGTTDNLGLVAYSCSGPARPDENAHYASGVPQGLICADHGTLADGSKGYCCTERTTTCAYNPLAVCDPTTYGYRCQGANRPETLNTALTCGQGVDQGDLIDYCCSAPKANATAGCQQSDSVTCPAGSPPGSLALGLIGWSCTGQSLPTGQEFGPNKSRADYYYLFCGIPTPAENPKISNYCCYTPALVPEGGSCVQDTMVPGCQAGRFGIACYGRDTPEDDFQPMHCPDPGVAGQSAQGYPATLYCCDYKP